MHDVLNQNLFFIEEHVGFLKAANNYDVYDPRTQEMIIICREEDLSFATKIVRFSPFKNRSGFNLIVRTAEGEKLLVVRREGGASIYKTKIEVLDADGQLIGKFQAKSSPKGNFEVLSPEDALLYSLNKSGEQDFTFIKEGNQLAKIGKKWAGASKELLTTADNYLLQIMVTVPPNDPLRLLIFAAVLCIDMVLYE